MNMSVSLIVGASGDKPARADGTGMRTLRLRRLAGDAWTRAAAGAALIAVLAVSWWEMLFLPLGDSHDGRINGRFGLAVRNFLENGWAASGWLSDISPFSDVPYTHHPPLLNFIHAAVGGLAGTGEWQLRLPGYISGLAAVAALLWLLREADVGAGASAMAAALAVCTPMFWIYARLGLGVTPLLILLALWRRMERRSAPRPGGRPGRGETFGLAAAGALAALASWTGAALVMLVAGWGSLGRRLRRVSAILAAAGLGAAALTALWIGAGGGFGELAGHISERMGAPGAAEFVSKYRWFYGVLYPWWIRWMILPGLVAAFWSARTRLPAAWLTAALGLWTLAAPQAAFVHDYWTFPLLFPAALGWAVLLEGAGARWGRLTSRLSGGRWLRALPAAALVGGLAFYALSGAGDFREAYFRGPARAGELLAAVPPPASQTAAWTAPGVGGEARWVSYYWDLPVEELDSADLDRIADGDLVLACRDVFGGAGLSTPEPRAVRGNYALYEFGELRNPPAPLPSDPC